MGFFPFMNDRFKIVTLLLSGAFLCGIQNSWADLIYAKDDYRTGAMVALRNGRDQEALSLMNKAIEQTPDDPILYLNRTTCFLRTNNPKMALADIEKAFSLKKDKVFPAPVETFFYLNRGSVFVELKRTKEALADMKRAVEIYPSNEGAQWQLGKLYDKQGDPKLALQHLKVAQKIYRSEKLPSDLIDKEIKLLESKTKGSKK